MYEGRIFVLQRLHELAEDLVGRLPLQGLARPVVEQISDRVQRGLVMHRQVRALGQELADQPVDVLAAAALPGAVGVAEVHPHARVAGQLAVTRHLLALVVGQRLAQRLRDEVELVGEGRQGRLCRGIGHAAQHHHARGALHQHAHGRGIARALDQVALPMPGHEPVIHLGRAHMDAHHLGDLAAPVLARTARAARAAGLAQAGDELRAQLAARVGVDGVVQRLVGELQARLVRVHALECVGNLGWRPAPQQHVRHHRSQRAMGIELARRTGLLATPPALRVRGLGAVGLIGQSIAPKLAADGAGAAPQAGGNAAQAQPLESKRRNRHALIGAQLLVSGGHLCNLPYRRAVALRV